MKAVVESMKVITLGRTESSKFIFMEILRTITEAKSEEDLRREMKKHFTNNFEYYGFTYGFGRNHMWVTHERSEERLIFVKLHF